MLPNKELQELVRALTQTPEYIEMMRLRRKIMDNMQLSRQMMFFEREHARIHTMNLLESEKASRLKKLYADHGALLEREDVKNFVTAVQQYQKMVSESIAYLNRHLDAANTSRPY